MLPIICGQGKYIIYNQYSRKVTSVYKTIGKSYNSRDYILWNWLSIRRKSD